MLAALALPLLAGAALASPVARNLATYTADIEIHESCNSTQRRMLSAALADTYEVVEFAHKYAANNGPQDPIFQMYFGNETANFASVLGVYSSVMTSNKEGVILRCDNPDGNCGQPGWRGHWRGSNATSETVICDLSYTDRLYNEAFCMFGFQVATSPISTYWSIDLLHRMLHVPSVTNDIVHHYAEDLSEVIELAQHNATYSPHDSDAIQYFAAHVYALEVAKGGDRCIGTMPQAHAGGAAAHSSSSAAPAASSMPAASSSSAAAAATSSRASAAAVPASSSAAARPSAASAAAGAATSAAGLDCHTHSDGTSHCV